MNLKSVYDSFITNGSFVSGIPFGNGHIHDTFYIKSTGSDINEFLLQRINLNVFKDVSHLQSNIGRVTNHIRHKLSLEGATDIARKTLTPVPASDGRLWHVDSNGDNWRMFLFIPGHQSFDIVDSADRAYQGGRAIGKFQAQLADLPGPPLHETIPFFHDIDKRLQAFHKTIKRDPLNRAVIAHSEIEFVKAREEEMKIIIKLGSEGRIPVRITHNDTKFNNILFDSDGKALCVIDLDTVMPGYVHYDFGDAIRTAASTASEDEKDMNKVNLDLVLFEAYARGYLDELRETLNDTEKEYLAFAPRLLTFTIALRFLTDYIDGDNYFKIHYEHQNLQRARTQFRLVESNEKQYDEMRSIISALS